MHPRQLSIDDFSYHLAEDKIAKHPLAERDSSKLLIYQNGQIESNIYKNIDQFIPPDALLVFNNTKVVEARLLFKKSTGAVIEIFCLEPGENYPDITSAMMAKGEAFWKCLIGGASKWKHGIKLEKQVVYNDQQIVLQASIVERLADCFVIQFNWQPGDFSFAEMLHCMGAIPLPPYLHRDAEEEDKNRYQTIYAQAEGSVAAPTAGLHFTQDVFDKLAAKKVGKDFVTLHVGAGTFKPVKSGTMEEHDMHAEFIDVSADTIENLVEHLNKTIVAVGTTSLRTMESLYWIGVKVHNEPTLAPDQLNVQQWEPYETSSTTLQIKDALIALLRWMNKHRLSRLITKTKILIAPGYTLKVAKGIITNFHQPNSTLLLLVAAIVGDDWKKIYDYALSNDYRFLSYGDGCLLWPNELTS